MGDDLRTMSIRFTTYNGHGEGLFASVGITTKFSLGERDQRRVKLVRSPRRL